MKALPEDAANFGIAQAMSNATVMVNQFRRHERLTGKRQSRRQRRHSTPALLFHERPPMTLHI